MQFSVLLKRGLKERSHESFSGLRIFMVMSVSLLSGLLWWHSRVAHIQDQVKTNAKPWILLSDYHFQVNILVVDIMLKTINLFF